MVFGTGTSALGCGSGSPLSRLLLTLSAYKRRMWCRRRRLPFGFRLLVLLLRPSLCEFSCRGKVFRVATVYAPNRNPDRNDFFDSVSSKMDVSVPTILCGDFN